MYLIRNINIKCKKFKNNPLENPVNFTRSLRISLARHNIDIDYSQVNYPIRQCGVCNSTITPNQYLFKYKAISTDIFDMEFDKHKYDKEYAEWHICDSKDCKNTNLGLNTNSIEFIMLAYNKNEEEAIKLIHSRNSTKFYMINHATLDDYKKFQGHLEVRENHQDIASEWHVKQIKTYNKNKELFIKEYGIDEWNIHNKKKDTMSESFHIKKYGDDYKYHLLERKASVASFKPIDLTYENCISQCKIYGIDTSETLFAILDDRLKDKPILSKKFFIDTEFKCIVDKNTHLNTSGICRYGFVVFNISIETVYNRYYITTEIEKAADNVIKTKYGRAYNVSEDGFYFRSDAEYTLYCGFKRLGIPVINVNKRYPSSKLYYDLYIELHGKKIYIEVAGTYDEEYNCTQLTKQNTFGSIIVYCTRVNEFIKDIENGKNIYECSYY